MPAFPESCRKSTIASAVPSRFVASAAALAGLCGIAVMRTPHVELRGFASRAAEAAAIADMIATQAAAHPAWRIVVLVRARTHAREIAGSCVRTALRFARWISSRCRIAAVVRDVIMLVCALLHLGDRTAWLAVLRAPWAGLSPADLLLISRAGPLIWEALSDDATLAQLSDDGRVRCRRLRMTLASAFAARNDGSVARWVERTWLSIGGASCASSTQDLQLARAAFARLRDLEQRGLPDAADLPESFADLYADHGVSSNVEIMTIHKAKGLEFDMVVLPALDRHVPRGADQLLVSHQFARTGRDGMVMAARPAVGADGDPLFEFLRLQQRDSAALEAQRLLYVACTRAKWQLRLTATIGRPEEYEDAAQESAVRGAWSPRVGSLLAVLWPILAAEFAVAAGGSAAQVHGDGAPRGGPLARVPRDWSPVMGSGPDLPEPMSSPPTLREETPVFDWAGETARRVGSLVHAELQVMELAAVDEQTIRAREPQYRRWLALHGVPAERLEEAAARVVAALNAVQKDPRGRWILQTARADVREYALSGAWRGEVAHVIFDRSFIDADGVRWVIDYKTSQHQGGGLEEFLDREVERYRPQLHRYALLAGRLGPEPVRLGLYFPLMRAWREWAA
jgi:ATP-dependent helicase/nuclease subunit A